MASPLLLPTHHRALILSAIKDGFEVNALPTPQPGLGNAIVRVEAASILSYHREVYNGGRHYDFPMPIVGGYSAVGRIAAVGLDATLLQPGQLVYIDCVIHSRDNPEDLFLTAIHSGMTSGSKKLIQDVWRNGNWAEFAKVPLENCIPLNETRLSKELGYTVQELTYISTLLVPFGGLRDIALQPGETIIISPATGAFGGAGCLVAIAMGCRVIAFGRNTTELARLKSHIISSSPTADIETVEMTGDEAVDIAALKVFGTIDAVLDFTPPQASTSSHLRSAISCLRRGGRVSLMGFNANPINAGVVTGRNILLKGKLMYEREDMVFFVKMMERGLFARGGGLVDIKAFGMEQWTEALDVAVEYMGVGRGVIFVP